MKNFETDPSMPWNQRSWFDTFVQNKAFETHAMDMIVAMNEIRQEKKAEKEAMIERAVHLANTYAMLGGRKH